MGTMAGTTVLCTQYPARVTIVYRYQTTRLGVAKVRYAQECVNMFAE